MRQFRIVLPNRHTMEAGAVSIAEIPVGNQIAAFLATARQRGAIAKHWKGVIHETDYEFEGFAIAVRADGDFERAYRL